MDLVEDDRVDAFQAERGREAERLCGRPALKQQVLQDLRCHDNNISIWAEFDVAGHNPNRREHRLQVMELLITEGLDGGRVEHTPAETEAVRDLVFGNESFTRSGFGCHEDILLGVDGCDSVFLPVIKGELVGYGRDFWKHQGRGLDIDSGQVRG